MSLINERRATRVGAVVLILTIAGIAALLIVGKIDLRSHVRFEVEFGHVGALEAGADVQIAGRVVGKVESIRLTDSGAIAQVALQKRYADWAPSNGELFVAAKGLIGARYLAIGPPPNGALPTGQIAEGARLRGVDPVQVEKVVLRSIENTRRFRELVIELRPAARLLADELATLGELLDQIEPRPGAYAALADQTSQLIAGAGDTRDLLEAGGLTPARVSALATRAGALGARLSAELSAIETDLDASIANVDRLRGSVPVGSLVRLRLAVDRARGLGDRVTAISKKVSAIADGINRGEGTVGALLNDPEFINEAKKLGKILKRQPWRLLGTDRPDKAPRRR